MKMKPGKFCPLIKKDCIELKCSWYTQVRGMNPNTGEEIDEWGCAITWLPMMQIETSQQARQAGAAVESFRNEVVRTNSQNQQLYIEHMKKVQDGNILPAEVSILNDTINILANLTEENSQ